MDIDDHIQIIRKYIEENESSEPYHQSELGKKAWEAVTYIQIFADDYRYGDDD